MKKIILGLVVITLTSLNAFDIESSIKEETSGGDNYFRAGMLFGLGLQGSTKDLSVNVGGLEFNAGGYMLVNVFNKLMDLELGVIGKYSLGGDEKPNSDNVYTSGLAQVSIYAGPVIEFDDGYQAVGFGVSKALYIEEVRTDAQDSNNVPKHDLESGLGVYLEYQWIKDKKDIYFTRLEASQFTIKESLTTPEEEQTVASLMIGAKF